MKKIGIIAALFVTALLAIGVVSALTANEPLEKATTVKVIDQDQLKTSDGSIYNFTFHSVSNESGINSVNNPDGKEVTVEKAGPGLIKVGSHIYKLNYVINTEIQSEYAGSVAPGNSDAYGPYSWNAGDQVSVSATWTPTDQDVYLGILDLIQDKGQMAEFSGGSGNYMTTVPWTSDEWGKFILNPYGNTATVYYTLS